MNISEGFLACHIPFTQLLFVYEYNDHNFNKLMLFHGSTAKNLRCVWSFKWGWYDNYRL